MQASTFFGNATALRPQVAAQASTGKVCCRNPCFKSSNALACPIIDAYLIKQLVLPLTQRAVTTMRRTLKVGPGVGREPESCVLCMLASVPLLILSIYLPP